MNKRKNLILLVTLFLLGWVLVTPANRIGRFSSDSYTKAPVSSDSISFREMNSFLTVWSQFLQKDTARRGLQQMSLSTGKPSESLPTPLVRWLQSENWNPDRFFFVEQRLRVIVKTALLLEHLEANQKLLAASGGANRANLTQIVEEQARQINAEKITPTELKLVSGNLYKINSILEGKAVYEPD